MQPFSRRAVIAGGAAAAISGRVHAADYPSRVVRVVVPYPAGGSNDIVARLLAQTLAERDNQAFIVDNRDGAGGNIGAKIVASAEPDGYTLLLTAPAPLTINNALFRKMNYDAATDFTPIALVATVPIVLVVNPSLGVATVAELVALAKAKPGTINFGSAGIGTISHLAGQLLKTATGIDIVHVPYRGEAPAINDLIAGVTQMMFNNLPSMLPQIQAKTVKAIAVAGAARARALPDVPTVAASGVPGFEASAWFGLVGPAKMPDSVLTTLIADTEAVLATPDLRGRFLQFGAEPGTVSGDAFRRALAAERVTWGKIISASGAAQGP